MSENEVRVLPGEMLIDHYKTLAAEIVARGVSDYVVLKIFQRDDHTGRWDEMYVWGAENQHDQWLSSLAGHAERKRLYRRIIHKLLGENEEDLKNIERWQKDIEVILAELDIQKTNLKITKASKEDLNATGLKRSDVVKALTDVVKRLDSEDARLRLRIKKTYSVIGRRNVRIANYRKKIQAFKQEEWEHRSRMTLRSNRKQMRRYVKGEIARYEDWFFSEQFAILAEADPQAIIDRTDKRVAEGLDKPMKEFWFMDHLRTAMKSQEDRARRKKRKASEAKETKGAKETNEVGSEK